MTHLLILFPLLIASFSLPAEAIDEERLVRLLSPSDIRSILGAYPARGSSEELTDFAILFKYQLTRSAQDCAKAAADEKVSLQNFFAGAKGPLTKAEVSRLTPRLIKGMGEAGINILNAKRLYHRPRPYVLNPLIKPCITKEHSSAYPSGHTAFSRVMAIVLARIYPERQVALIERADEIALGRVIGGVHHPSDIIAGKKLADAIAAEALSSPEFLEELSLVE